MLDKIVIGAAVLGTGGYMLHKSASIDPTVFPQPREQVQKILMEAKTSLPRRDGPGTIQVWSARRTERGVMLNMQSATRAPLITCEIVITAVAPDKTRVVPGCASDGKTASAQGQTLDQMMALMFEEHVHATLEKRPFDRGTVDRKTQAVVLKNLGGMQREALRMSDEMNQLDAKQGR